LPAGGKSGAHFIRFFFSVAEIGKSVPFAVAPRFSFFNRLRATSPPKKSYPFMVKKRLSITAVVISIW